MPPGRTRQATIDVHLSGTCSLDCVVCDCAVRGPSLPEIERLLEGGGSRVTLRSADTSPLLEPVARLARERGFAEIRVRTSGVDFTDAASAGRLRTLGVDAVVVPFFSQRSAAHDRIARRPDALVRALVGVRALAEAGLAIDAEVPLLGPRWQDPVALVELLVRAVPGLRAARFHHPLATLPPEVAAPRWSEEAPLLARALERCRALGVATVIGDSDHVPICALRGFPEVQERVVRFSVRGRKPSPGLPPPCEACAVKRQCSGVSGSYRALHGVQDLAPYAARPKALFAAQRTTPQRKWTDEQRAAARKVGLQVLRPTVNCNQDCVFCSANETSGNVWEDPSRMIRTIARRARTGVYQISFGGGEPTLSKHLVDFVATASRAGVRDVDIVTNAVLLARPGKVEELRAAGLTRAFVSLHAHDEALSRTITLKSGDFDKTRQGIHNLLRAGVAVTINHVVSRLNYRYLRRFVEFLHAEFEGRVSLSFAFVTPQYRALENLALVPRLTDVMPYLARAMYRALELGQRFVVGSRQGIPPCFLKEFAPWSDVLMMAEEAATEDGHQKQKAEACGSCRYREFCTGLWKPYVARHGTSEIAPVPGRLITREEVVRPSERGGSTVLWVDRPTSFEAAPSEVRDREAEARGVEGWPFTAAPPVDVAVGRSRPLRALLIGSGQRARALFDAASEARVLTVDAVASPHAPEGEPSRFGFCPTYASAEEAALDVLPECLVVASSTRSHEAIVRLALSSRLPALVEKPVGGESDVVRALARESESLGVSILPAHQLLHADGLDRLLDAGPHATVRCVRRVRAGQADLPRSWARGALFETLYHWIVVLNALAGGAPGSVVVLHRSGDSRPERFALRLVYPASVAELVVEGDAVEDELAFTAGDREWARTGGKLRLTERGVAKDVERTGSDAAHLLHAFARVVQDGERPRSTLRDAALAIDATNLALAALESSGVEFGRPAEPRHAASAGLRTSY